MVVKRIVVFVVVVIFVFPLRSECEVCSRIVSLAPSITETLFYLHLGDKVVGVTRYAKWPRYVRNIPKVGGYYNPNLGLITTLRPTVVFYTYHQRQIEHELEKLGLRAFMLRFTSISDIVASMRRIIEICGIHDGSRIKLFVKRIKRLSFKCRVGSPKRVLVAFGDPGVTPIVAAGGGGIYGSILRAIHAVNVYRTNMTWGTMPLSAVIKVNPQVVFVLTSKDRKKVLEDWMKLPIYASKHKSVWVLNKDVYFVPGPRILFVMKVMMRRIYPECHVR